MTSTAADFRAINQIDDLIASLVAWRGAIDRVGYDRNYALPARISATDAAATLFECDALTGLADEARAELDADQPDERDVRRVRVMAFDPALRDAA